MLCSSPEYTQDMQVMRPRRSPREWAAADIAAVHIPELT
jgi:hypothetical protein